MVSSVPAFLPGALVRARGRDWVVLPPDEPAVIRLRPVDGVDDDGIGIYLPFEPNAVAPATYPPPDPARAGGIASARLLRDAVRLTLRSGAGPFRSLGRLSVAPRPYQFVPLLMALRLDPVRLLIADDVGVGKTIEAAMIARELLDRGVVRRIAVLCAPHLCDQWERELREKFDIHAAVVQSSRVGRLERDLPRRDVSLYQYYQHLVVSVDFVKLDRNKRPFLDNAPDLVIVDEAHTMARPRSVGDGGQQLRYELLRDLAADGRRHLVLTTATPHSGIESSFRSLLGLLDPAFDVPEEQELSRPALLPHVVQRRRVDIKAWLGDESPFPDRQSAERSYLMTPEYLRLYDAVLAYCRESVAAGGMAAQRQRVRYWAAIAILRCVLSSPAAAAAMLEKRRDSRRAGGDADEPATDERFRSQILDSSEDDQPPDYAPRAPLDDPAAGLSDDDLQRLDRFLVQARALAGPKTDAKLATLIESIDALLGEGFRPIVYCRFIATAEYVAAELAKALGRRHTGLVVTSVTGGDGDAEQREERVRELTASSPRVLVATDCLSEGINLQEHFDAVIHYDLPWNPNRLEQREGRVDRFGQQRPVVKSLLLYGTNNEIDLVVLDVLIRKAITIRKQLGVAVPVPADVEEVVQAVVETVLLRQRGQGRQLNLALEDQRATQLQDVMEAAAKKERDTRAFFAQAGIQPGEVARELDEVEPALGSAADIERFVREALVRLNGEARPGKPEGVFHVRPGDAGPRIHSRDPRLTFPLKTWFRPAVPPQGAVAAGRNHPLVTALADEVLGRALTSDDPWFTRCGAIATRSVAVRTGIALLRFRYRLATGEHAQFAEEVLAVAFQRDGDTPVLLEPFESAGLALLEAEPAAELPPAERSRQVEWALGLLADGDWWRPVADRRKAALEAAHARLRSMTAAAAMTAHPYPPDILGLYVLLPAAGA